MPDRLLAEALAAIEDGVLVQSADGIVLVCNPRAAEIVGLDVSDVLGRRVDELPLTATLEDGSPFPVASAFGRTALATGKPARRVLIQLGRRDDSYVWVLASQRPLINGDGGAYAAATSLVEITDRWEGVRHMAYLATHDVLTRLPNRWTFEEQLHPALARAGRHGSAVVVLFMDLNGFKEVNDQLGHAAGDELLRRLADRLRAVTRDGDLLCRYGGDEFVVLVPDVERESARFAAGALIGRLRPALREPFEIADGQLEISMSVGSAIYPLDAEDAAELVHQADTEMYRQKRLRGV